MIRNLEKNDYGYLNVTVYSDTTHKPLKNALVRITELTVMGLYRERGVGRFITEYLTDENGKVPIIKLAPRNNLESNMDDSNKSYNMSVHADNYHSAYAFEIQIFKNVTTSYAINLRSVESPGDFEYEFILNPIIPGH
jgi:hypothetical protein